MKRTIIGIRREDKNKWERRIPFIPQDLADLQNNLNVEFLVQSSPIRIYPDDDFTSKGIIVTEDISSANIIFAVKEIPVQLIEKDKTYIFFSHTVKGQSYNMPLLQKILDVNATMIDYERIIDEQGRRLVFFGLHAGYAGMIDALHLLGKRHKTQGHDCSLAKIKMAYEYPGLSEAKSAIAEVGELIKTRTFKNRSKPFIVGFAGYGNVSLGAQSILDILPTTEITPEELLDFYASPDFDKSQIYKVVFKEKHLVERIDGSDFELQTYYDHPELFRSVFAKYLPCLTMLMNAIYWTEDYPRLVTKADLKKGYEMGILNNLEIIGDISIDIDGSIECSYKATEPDNPCYVYEPLKDGFRDGVEGDGPIILAVDNLPCEISKEASETFSTALKPFMEDIVAANWELPFEELKLPAAIKTAIITHKGELMPDYTYMKEFLDEVKP